MTFLHARGRSMTSFSEPKEQRKKEKCKHSLAFRAWILTSQQKLKT